MEMEIHLLACVVENGIESELKSLLDLALRSTAAAADPLNEDVTCFVDIGSLLKTPSILKDLQTSGGGGGETVSEADVVEEPLITGMETFSVNYKVQWPLSLVISKKALTKYQLIFRFLFHCKHVHRQLCAAWQLHQGARVRDMHGTASLHHQYYVLEPNWHVMHNKLENAKSINEKFEKLKLVCLQYASATQWLMSSIEAPDSNSSFDDLHSSSLENVKVLKLRKSSKKPNSPTDESTVIECVLKFEREFSSELESLRPILSSRAQAEPYLTHLAQLILGVGMDHQM
ncbi:unnamed protein product [Lactuca virosa]|uniref:Gamma-tubulin complex component n=1 Tax=Lactuca virosa TaxID=75947 RepID=A0AAU9N8U4_9ASTR|nr:unnamed protein product [Lactuca virosa]